MRSKKFNKYKDKAVDFYKGGIYKLPKIQEILVECECSNFGEYKYFNKNAAFQFLLCKTETTYLYIHPGI